HGQRTTLHLYRLDGHGAAGHSAGAAVLVGRFHLHGVRAGGRVDVVHLHPGAVAGGPGDDLDVRVGGRAVAPVDGVGEAGGLVGRRRLGGREGEGARLAGDAVARADQARVRGHLQDLDGSAPLAAGAVLVGDGDADGVTALGLPGRVVQVLM